MGLLEFLEWCEDLNMQPVLGVYAGYSLRGGARFAPGPELEPYVKEALEEIENVTGDATTTWGARRAKDGHSAPSISNTSKWAMRTAATNRWEVTKAASPNFSTRSRRNTPNSR